MRTSINLQQTIPGTYRIADIGRFVKQFKVYNKQGNKIPTEQITTNQWQISNPEDAFLIRYEVYDIWDFEVEENEIYRMAGSSLENDHALINTPGILGYINDNRDREYYINIIKPDLWTAATALPSTIEGVYVALNFDHLVDSPFLIADLSSTSTTIGSTDIGVHIYSANEQVTALAILNDIEQVMLDAQSF